jgi:hypothetical protein
MSSRITNGGSYISRFASKVRFHFPRPAGQGTQHSFAGDGSVHAVGMRLQRRQPARHLLFGIRPRIPACLPLLALPSNIDIQFDSQQNAAMKDISSAASLRLYKNRERDRPVPGHNPWVLESVGFSLALFYTGCVVTASKRFQGNVISRDELRFCPVIFGVPGDLKSRRQESRCHRCRV